MPKLSYPLPKGIEILNVWNDGPGQEPTFVLSVALPWGVVELLSQTLELAARLTGNDKLGGNLAAVCLECLGEWSAQAAEAGHLEGLEEKA
jgi:hypothetical protein